MLRPVMLPARLPRVHVVAQAVIFRRHRDRLLDWRLGHHGYHRHLRHRCQVLDGCPEGTAGYLIRCGSTGVDARRNGRTIHRRCPQLWLAWRVKARRVGILGWAVAHTASMSSHSRRIVWTRTHLPVIFESDLTTVMSLWSEWGSFSELTRQPLPNAGVGIAFALTSNHACDLEA